jgi:PTH1 family peptidyl-tRNA hydrolase
MAPSKLIVGLGNPGRQYLGTRHNVGFEVLDELATALGWIAARADFDRQARADFGGLVLQGTVTLPGGVQEKLLLLKPQTYMNLSGSCVQAAAAFHRMPPQALMVVLDDLALPCGRLRLRAAGSAGGHNGLKDIERALGTQDYPRLRLGIDPPPPQVPGRAYVLERFTAAQRPLVDAAVRRAAEALQVWLAHGLRAAMDRFNAPARGLDVQ